MSGTETRPQASFDFVRYANCWEDADILCEALQPAPGRRMLSIASGGDNAFALVTAGAEVVAADLSVAQLATVELKMAAIRSLAREDLLAFLGVQSSPDRGETYRTFADQLSTSAQAYWAEHPEIIGNGVIHAGKFERFLSGFGRWVLPLVHRRRTIEDLMTPRTPPEREAFYRDVWDNRRWRLLFRIAMSRTVLGRGGRDPEFFRHVDGPVSERLLARVGRALSTLSLDRNPYLDYILHGNYTRALPRYLEPEALAVLRDRLGNLTLFHGPIDEAARQYGKEQGFDGFNLSDLFEYLDEAACLAIYRTLLAAARPGARLAYWNMLVPRRCPAELADRVRSLDELAEALFQRDAAFFYSAFVVEEVR